MRLDIKNIHDWPIKSRLVILLIVFIIVLSFGYFFDITSLQNSLATTMKQEDDLKTQYQLIVGSIDDVRHENASYPKLQQQLAVMKQTLITHKQLSDLMNEILKIGSANQLYFNLFDPGQPAKEKGYIKIPIKVIVVGSYHQLASFISQIGNLHWLVVVGDFSFSTENKNDVLGAALAQKANAENLLTAEINLSIYQQDESENHAK